MEFTEDVQAWQKHHASDIFLSEYKDPLRLDVVCVTGRPLAYNVFMHFFQKRAFIRALHYMGSMLGKKVLDVGCGSGRWSRLFRDHDAKVIGIDISEKRLEENRKEIECVDFQFMNVTSLKHPDKSFDIVNSVTVLQHLPFDLKEKAVQEMSRVTKKNGHVLLIEGVNDTLLPSQSSFLYDMHKWTQLFEKNGFTLVFFEKHLDMFLTDWYIAFDSWVKKKTRTILNLKEPEKKGLFDVSYLERISADKKNNEKGKKFRTLRILYRSMHNSILTVLIYLSYPLEYVNFYVFKRYHWYTGTFLFEKK